MIINIVGCVPKSKLNLIAQAQIEKANTPESTPVPGNTISKEVTPKIIEKKGNALTPASPVEGKLIQIGGSIEALATELAIELDIEGNNVVQILAINEYLTDHWHYIHDPYKDKDTWRSAETTIALRYNGKFPGDCDDFAILNASLAKQIGLRARVVGGYDGDSGHAFAEFFLPDNRENRRFAENFDNRKDYSGIWISLDWFKGTDHNRYVRDIQILGGD
ncbi:hypothetical protein LH29_01805 [Draconibacterium sediminis]|uniref:Transglutaminase-like domain-containing protein n=2 Tax=Draconibacterium sediminis TaxID=1544798 RepID=A0A0D8JCM9_9BACT|nr:hypothetical protein LH29_01805 [Draconibacterium sediminis]